MYSIVFNNKKIQCRNDETVLDALLRQGVEVSFSCRKGSCQVCMLQCSNGDVSGEAQKDLRPVFKKNGYFLPCQCKPSGDLVISEIDHERLYTTAYVHKKEFLSETVCRFLIATDKMTEYKAGQFINVSRPLDGITRSYSIANIPKDNPYIELHVQRMKNGKLSNWIFDDLNEQDEIEIQGPNGHCVYQSGTPECPILMVATGTGLAPILGVLREAISSHHTGIVHVYHEVNVKSDLYLDSLMRNLSKIHTNISYFPCLSTVNMTEGIFENTSSNRIQSNYTDLNGWMVYLAGSGQMVSELYDIVIVKGASNDMVFSDSFDLKDLRQSGSIAENSSAKRVSDQKQQSLKKLTEVDYPQADPEIWNALDDGKKLNKILNEFYTIVYNDARLSPFFANITKQRSIEKVYLFLRQIFTGEKVYFGDRPRNAHHWMVISDELFDYREDIMASCLRDNNIPEHLIKRWRAIEELFRPDIVKSKPWNKFFGDIEIPVESFDELVLDSGTMCDSCQQPVEAGTHVRYHMRLGTVYCPSCMSEDRS